MIRLYFIRHADAYNESGIQEESFPLNNYGKVQAIQLARRLKINKFDAFYCSKIQRAMDTCEIVNETHKMKTQFWSAFNEVGNESWPQPGIASSDTYLESFNKAVTSISKTFKHLVKECRKNNYNEVAIFTHGNWIRVLLCLIASKGDSHAFSHYMVHNTSLTIIDVDVNDFEHIVTVSDAAHTQLFKTVI